MVTRKHRRLEELEQETRSVPNPPAETPEVLAAREEFQAAQAALRERTGGERIDHSDADPEVGQLAAKARAKFRRYVRVSRQTGAG